MALRPRQEQRINCCVVVFGGAACRRAPHHCKGGIMNRKKICDKINTFAFYTLAAGIMLGVCFPVIFCVEECLSSVSFGDVFKVTITEIANFIMDLGALSRITLIALIVTFVVSLAAIFIEAILEGDDDAE